MLAVDLSGSMTEPDMELGGAVVDRLSWAEQARSAIAMRYAA